MRPVPDEITVGELLKRCSKRPPDQAAWEEFVRRYHLTIKSFVRRTYHQKARVDHEREFPEDTIEDLVQTVYIKLIEGGNSALERFEGEHENSIFQYLGMISMNAVRDHFRAIRAQKRPKTISLDQLLMNRSFPEENAIAIENWSAAENHITFTEDEIDQVLNRMIRNKKRDRDILIFKLHFYEGLTFREITESLDLGLSPVSVGSIINRTVDKIRPPLVRARGIKV